MSPAPPTDADADSVAAEAEVIAAAPTENIVIADNAVAMILVFIFVFFMVPSPLRFFLWFYDSTVSAVIQSTIHPRFVHKQTLCYSAVYLRTNKKIIVYLKRLL